ncbi:MAG TPA: alternative ribosome rescue aminoacyl-tRNA hydrolase ArfB [Bdellovibrionota bacterium]|nr:alternative ribosome rescue aminoacyl-tRNA hydrolase ArfB [Bdellovibrionota bacterium]
MLFVTQYCRIPEWELEFSYARSSGPGGQNVNKVNSKAVLRWNPSTSRGLDEQARARVIAKLANKLSEDGSIVIASDRFRDQPRNREDCIEKLKELVAGALYEPKKRKKTKESFSSRKRSEESKRRHSAKKKDRQRRDFD